MNTANALVDTNTKREHNLWWSSISNQERWNRGLTQDPYCKFCPGEVQDLNHIFSQCSRAGHIWQDTHALAMEYEPGLKQDQENTAGRASSHLYWWIWQWWKAAVFGDRKRGMTPVTKVHLSKTFAKEVKATFSSNKIFTNPQAPSIIWIGWEVRTPSNQLV